MKCILIKPSKKNVIALAFIIILYAFSIGTAYNVGKTIVHSIVIRNPISNQSETVSPVESQQSMTDNKTLFQSEEDQANLISLIDRVILSIEDRYDSNVLFRNELIDFYGAIQLAMNKKMINDIEKTWIVYKMDNGQLTYTADYYDIKNNLGNMKELYDFLESRNTDLLYVQAPFKVNKYNNQLPYGIEDYANNSTDDLLKGFKEIGIPYLDLRDEIYKAGFEYENLFYNTDHHWTIKTAFWAYKHTFDYIQKTYGLEPNQETTNIDNFQSIDLQESFLGSQGKRVGKVYGGVDDFSYLIPEFETDYYIQVYNKTENIEKEIRGCFTDAIIVNDFVEVDAPIDTNRYTAYFGGDYPFTRLTNYKQNGGRLLIIKDSFALPFSAFMSLNFQETDIIDLRASDNMSLFKYLENNQYDLVMFLYDPHQVSNENLFDFEN